MGKKGITIISSVFLIAFYIAIIMYLSFGILHIELLDNFISAIVFDIIGFILLFYCILKSILSKSKIGFCIPLIILTVCYTIILNVINLVLIFTLSNSLLVLFNLLLLFIYCLISIPIYIMGRK